MENLKQQLDEKMKEIEKELEQEKDILLKLDKKKGILKVYSQQVKKL